MRNSCAVCSPRTVKVDDLLRLLSEREREREREEGCNLNKMMKKKMMMENHHPLTTSPFNRERLNETTNKPTKEIGPKQFYFPFH